MSTAGRHLYVIQSDVTGSVKIGRSDNPEARLAQLQTGSAYALRLLAWFENKGPLERGVHASVAQYRLKGEWFHYDCLPNLPDWIYEKLPFEDRWFVKTSNQ